MLTLIAFIVLLFINQIRISKNSSSFYEYNILGLTNTIHATNRSQIATTKTMTSSSCVNRSGSLKNFKMPTTEGVRRILSREEVQ